MVEVATSMQMWVVLAMILIAIIFYASEWVALELTSLGFIVACLLLFHFAPVELATGKLVGVRELLAGFSEPALVAVLCLMVVGQGLVRTGALEGPVQIITRAGRERPALTIAAVLLCVAVFSAFVNNTPIVVVFIPVMSALAERTRRAPARLMMPLSFAAILGGMTTLIGSSTNLMVAGAYDALGRGQIGFFDFVVPGSFLAICGLLYVFLILPHLITVRADDSGQQAAGRGRQYIVQWHVPANSALIGEAAVAGMFPSLIGMTVRMVQRGAHVELPPFDDFTLQRGDVVVVAATRTTLMGALARSEVVRDMLDKQGGERGEHEDPVLVEVEIAPASGMIGRTLKQIGFQFQTGCLVLGVQRRSRMVRAVIDDIRLEAGDVLLVYGSRRNVTALRTSRDILLLEWSRHDVPVVWRAKRARIIFLATVACAVTGLLPITIAALAGAVAMIAFGCLNVHQAARAVDRRVALLVAAALAMGVALQATGGAAYIANSLISALSDFGPAVVLSAMFLMIAILTNVISNNATALLFTPIALQTADLLQVDPRAFLFAVVFAANCSFASPMGYQTNLLVMGPGHYSFADFLKAGAPLVLLIWLLYSVFAPWYYGF